jgi:hypothetical protein
VEVDVELCFRAGCVEKEGGPGVIAESGGGGASNPASCGADGSVVVLCPEDVELDCGNHGSHICVWDKVLCGGG